MAMPTSERRLTRSQTRHAGNRPILSRAKEGTPVAARTPSTSNPDAFSKAGRRVLAELACNDSPVVGLLPAGTPSSAKLKSSIAGPKMRRALLANAASELSTSTPTGESLLRSQVQLLLQKVDSDTSTTHRAPSLRTLCHLNGFLASPTMLAAPMNTPACTTVATSVPSPAMPPAAEDSHPPVAITTANFRPFDAADLSFKSEIVQQVSEVTALQSQESPSTKHRLQTGKVSVTGPQNVSSTSELTIAESVTSGRNQQVLQLTPLVLEGIDAATSTDIFLGKRTLQFDTPDKAPSAKNLSMVTFGDTCPPSSVRELEDDEVSEWSVHVNVGSPEGKSSLLESAELTPEEGASEAETEISTGLHEHVQKMQEECSIKVDLLWDRRTRQATPYRKASPEEEEEEEEEEEDEGGEYCSGREEEDEGVEEYRDCENLCNEFRGMGFLEEEEEERRGLPRGEGQHIRFLYADNDEILEAMVVTGEAMSGATRLKGLPAPRGRHWRFLEEEEADN